MPLKIDGDHPPLLLQRANVAVADVLRESILAGHIAPGERIKEEDLAEALGVSRTPVREALLVLAAEGLVDLPANRGARPTVRILENGEFSVIYDLRSMLEGYAAGRAAGSVTPALIAELEASCERLESIPVGEVAALAAENRKFHSAILAVADSARLSIIVGTMLQIPLTYKISSWSDPAFHRLAVKGHKRIVKALRSGDPVASTEQMRRHLEEVAADSRRRAEVEIENSAAKPSGKK